MYRQVSAAFEDQHEHEVSDFATAVPSAVMDGRLMRYRLLVVQQHAQADAIRAVLSTVHVGVGTVVVYEWPRHGYGAPIVPVSPMS